MNVHLEPLSDLLPLAVALWGSFARLFVVLSPSWTPFFGLFWAVLSLPSVWFLVFSLVPLLLWLLCVVSFCLCFGLLFCGCLLFGLCVPPLVLRGFLVCCFCCAVSGSPPPLAVVSLPPPSVVPLRRPGPVTVLVPPSGYLVASCDGPVALPICEEMSDICGEMNPFGLFCIGRSEFGFHLDGELNRDG